MKTGDSRRGQGGVTHSQNLPAVPQFYSDNLPPPCKRPETDAGGPESETVGSGLRIPSPKSSQRKGALGRPLAPQEKMQSHRPKEAPKGPTHNRGVLPAPEPMERGGGQEGIFQLGIS